MADTTAAQLPKLPTLDQAPTAQKADVASYDAAQSTATNWNVTPDQTVQSRIQGIIGENSDLLKQAKTNALADANGRGLINSSMAVGAGQQAVINTALPIAQQDAATYAQSAQFNAGQATQNSQFNTGLITSARAATAQAQNQSNQAQTQAQNALIGQQQAGQIDLAKMGYDANTKVLLQQMDAETRTNLANIQSQYQREIASTQGAAQAFQEAIKQIGAIQNNSDMDAAGRTAAINTQLQLLQNAMRVSSVAGTLGLDQILDFSTPVKGAEAVSPAAAPAPTPADSYNQYRNPTPADAGSGD